MPLTAEALEPTLGYLSAFFSARHADHREMMRDAGGAKYPTEPYVGHNEAIEFIRDAVLLAEDSFSDLRIPQGFPTPNDFLRRATAYRDVLDKNARRVEELNKLNKNAWFSGLSYAQDFERNPRCNRPCAFARASNS